MTSTTKPDDKIVGLVSFLGRWSVLLVATLGVIGVVFVQAWSWATPAIDSAILAPLGFAAILGASYLHLAALGGLIVTLVAVARKQRVAAAIALVGTLVALQPIGAALLQRGSPTDPNAQSITVYSANLLYGRSDLDVLERDINRINPDVLLLQETTSELESLLVERFQTRFPHLVRAARNDAFGQTTLSRLPFSRPPVVYPATRVTPGRGWVPQIGIWVHTSRSGKSSDDEPTKEIEIWNVHTLPPVGISYVIDQDQMSRAFLELAEASTADAIVFAGDFNCPEDGPVVRRLLNAGFQSSHRSLGRFTGWTWPAGRLPLARTRIDQVLSRGTPDGDAEPVAEGRGAFNGSDHLPVWATIQITPAQ